MKRRKFLKSTAMAVAATALPAAVLAKQANPVHKFGPNPEVVCEHDFQPWDWHCKKCGISMELAEEFRNFRDYKNDDHVPPLKRIYRMEPNPASRTVTVQGLDENYQVVKETIQI